MEFQKNNSDKDGKDKMEKKPPKWLYAKGDRSSSMFFVMKGTVEFWLPDNLSSEPYFTITAGNFFGLEDYIGQLNEGLLQSLKQGDVFFSDHQIHSFGRRIFNVKLPVDALIFEL